jgi:hypothetical protein
MKVYGRISKVVEASQFTPEPTDYNREDHTAQLTGHLNSDTGRN